MFMLLMLNLAVYTVLGLDALLTRQQLQALIMLASALALRMRISACHYHTHRLCGWHLGTSLGGGNTSYPCAGRGHDERVPS
jgi:Na+/glutamate symporter